LRAHGKPFTQGNVHDLEVGLVVFGGNDAQPPPNWRHESENIDFTDDAHTYVRVDAYAIGDDADDVVLVVEELCEDPPSYWRRGSPLILDQPSYWRR